ncbi:MAG TPA: DUF2975 domain-containing protein [Lachnospiraceae bacterium]|nr:DUF2975 domain-containing protein [Lachnospiraceae bacterium]
MEQKHLAGWLKLITIGVGIIGAIVYLGIIPWWGRDLVLSAPEFSTWYYPWLIFAWITAVPCYAALIIFWGICKNIGADNSFCEDNSIRLKHISQLAALDSAMVMVGNVVLFLLSMNHPGIFILLILVVFIGIAITVVAAGLSHLVYKAWKLKEENELTI